MSKRRKNTKAAATGNGDGAILDPERPRLTIPDDILSCIIQYMDHKELFRCDSVSGWPGRVVAVFLGFFLGSSIKVRTDLPGRSFLAKVQSYSMIHRIICDFIFCLPIDVILTKLDFSSLFAY
jgi:hypothetical protein